MLQYMYSANNGIGSYVLIVRRVFFKRLAKRHQRSVKYISNGTNLFSLVV